jgi:hypothetical protein
MRQRAPVGGRGSRLIGFRKTRACAFLEGVISRHARRRHDRLRLEAASRGQKRGPCKIPRQRGRQLGDFDKIHVNLACRLELLLLAALLSSADGFAKRARVPSVECHLNRRRHSARTRITNQHPDPSHRLQSKPMQPQGAAQAQHSEPFPNGFAFLQHGIGLLQQSGDVNDRPASRRSTLYRIQSVS